MKTIFIITKKLGKKCIFYILFYSIVITIIIVFISCLVLDVPINWLLLLLLLAMIKLLSKITCTYVYMFGVIKIIINDSQ